MIMAAIRIDYASILSYDEFLDIDELVDGDGIAYCGDYVVCNCHFEHYLAV